MPTTRKRRSPRRLTDEQYRAGMLKAILAVQAEGEHPTLERIAAKMGIGVNTRKMPGVRLSLIESGEVTIADLIDPDDESNYDQAEMAREIEEIRRAKRVSGHHRTLDEMPWRVYRHPGR